MQPQRVIANARSRDGEFRKCEVHVRLFSFFQAKALQCCITVRLHMKQPEMHAFYPELLAHGHLIHGMHIGVDEYVSLRDPRQHFRVVDLHQKQILAEPHGKKGYCKNHEKQKQRLSTTS